MTISLPTFKRDGNRYIQVSEGSAVKAATLMSKHSPTISISTDTFHNQWIGSKL